jgi:serine phosphatase RsbU (regulator of sigma subunit)
VPGFDVAAEHLAGGIGVRVGGDVYDVFDTGEGSWGVLIADVCGKGAPAASLTGVTRHTARAAAMRGDGPMAVLRAVNSAVLAASEELRFCTAAYGRLSSGPPCQLTLACAGHPPPLLRRAVGTVEEIGGKGMLLGVVREPLLEEQEVQLDPGDVVVLYTDGITDAWRDGPDPGEARLVEVLAGLPADADARTLAAGLRDAALGARGERVADDIAILVLRAR